MQYLSYKPILNPQEDIRQLEGPENPLHTRLAELSDGSRTTNEIISQLLLEKFNIGDIIKVLNELIEKKLIIESPESDLGIFSTEEIDAFEMQLNAFSKLALDRGELFLPYTKNAIKNQRALKEAKVNVIGDGETAVAFIQCLISIGIGSIYFYPLTSLKKHEEKALIQRIKASQWNFSDIFVHKSVHSTLDKEYIQGSPADLIVYVPENFSQETALEINQLCHDSAKNFLPYEMDFPQVIIGPLYRHKQSACYQCNVLRKRGAYNDFVPEKQQLKGSGFNLPLGVDMLCLEIIKYYTYMLDVLTIDNVWVFDMITGKSHLQTAFKLPRCPACGVHKIKPAHKLWENI